MKDYESFLKTKERRIIESGFIVNDEDLNPHLFDFQKFCVKRALKKGKYALFESCGLGKTIQQLEWANQVYKHTNKPILVLAPLSVSLQTIDEGAKFCISVKKYDGSNFTIQISNYERGACKGATWQNLRKLAAALKVKPNYFFD